MGYSIVLRMANLTEYETLSLVLAFMSIILIPLVWTALRGLVKWTRVENKLDNVVTAVEKLVTDKDVVHRELVDQMRRMQQELGKQMGEDRKATNERLQWLERHAWGNGHT